MSMNLVVLRGRLTNAVELRYTQSQKAVASFSLAVDRDFAQTGENREADFFNCVAWGKTAEFIQKYFDKGDMALVSGRMQNRSYEKDGQKRTVTEVIVDRVNFCGGKKDKEVKPVSVRPDDGELQAIDGELPF